MRRFDTPYVEGFGWDPATGALLWRGQEHLPATAGDGAAATRPEEAGATSAVSAAGASDDSIAWHGLPDWYSPRNPYYVRSDVANLLQE